MALTAKIAGIQGTNSGGSAADVVVQVPSPVENPDKLYVLYKANCNGVNLAYDNITNNITVTFIQVPASGTATADIFVQKEHSIWQGGTFIEATVNSGSNQISGVEFEPDIVMVTGGDLPNNASYSYDSTNKRITFNNLSANNTNVVIIKLHSIQHNQNGTSDGTGTLSGQVEKPEILYKKGSLIAVDQTTIDNNYDSANKRITGLTANTDYISIPIHSMFK